MRKESIPECEGKSVVESVVAASLTTLEESMNATTERPKFDGDKTIGDCGGDDDDGGEDDVDAEVFVEAVEVYGEIDEHIKVDIINVDDEEERRRVKPVVIRATGIEILYKSIEEFGRKVNVKGDGSCGYHSLMAGLKSVGKKFRDNLREFRYDLRQFVEKSKCVFKGCHDE